MRDRVAGLLGADGEEAAEPPPAPPTAEEVRMATAASVRSAFSVDSNYENYVFAITAVSTDADKAVLLANTLARLYRGDQIREKVEVTERVAAWLGDRVGELRAELDTQVGEIAELRARSELVSDESLAALNADAIELRGRLREAELAAEAATERLAALDSAEGALDAAAAQAVAAVAGDGQLSAAAAALGRDEAGAAERFGRRLEQLRLQVGAEAERAGAQVEDLRRAVADLSAQFETQAADVAALGQLEQEAEATRALYETFLSRLREASVQEDAHDAESRVLTEALWAGQIAPRPSRTLALSLLVGLVLGTGLVLGRELTQSTLRTAEELERLAGRPVLGQIPRIPVRARGDVIRFLRDKPALAAAEAVRDLRASLLLSEGGRPPQVILTTSLVPAEGKTTVTVALAHNFAGLGKRVLLIEGDIRRRTFDAYFGTAPVAGSLLSVAAGETSLAEAVVQPNGMGVDVLMGARSSLNAADLFSGEGWARLLEEARAQYDHVLIDTPPVLVVPDARVIAPAVDAVVYVVRWDATARVQVEQGLRQFRTVQVPVTGLVLSRIDPKGMRRYGYGATYGAYSRYGQAYYKG